MAESSSHNPSSPKITPKEEPVTLDKPESPNPFLPADQIEFTFEEIAFTTNNEVALLYPSHPNSEYFREVSDFISKCCLKEAFIRAPTQYKEYLSEFWYTAKTLDDSKIQVTVGDWGKRNSKKELSSSYVEATNGFFHLHSESASGHDASADSTAKADPGLSAPNDSISAQHDQSKSARNGLKTTHADSDESEEEEEVAKDKDTHA
ncbi:hypothetical protein Tco_1044717 [Tanacetum coccineum]|uniref:Uncharacterized protein n=1 Tax=Tanacetum coccineum TaxID=301880 RepID=A0ABQ5GSX2_9ASTR